MIEDPSNDKNGEKYTEEKGFCAFWEVCALNTRRDQLTTQNGLFPS